jgi:predicted methyltransferase
MKRASTAAIIGIAAAGIASGVWFALAYRRKTLDLEAERLKSLLGLRPGSRVADLGAGNGDMAARIGSMVGLRGQVHAIEIDSKKLETLRRRNNNRSGKMSRFRPAVMTTRTFPPMVWMPSTCEVRIITSPGRKR